MPIFYLSCCDRGADGRVAWLLHPAGRCYGDRRQRYGRRGHQILRGAGPVYGPSGMALVFLVAAGFAMPVVLLFRRLFRDKQPIAIPFLPFLACGCSVATLAELFL